jgi:hypothetical protein
MPLESTVLWCVTTSLSPADGSLTPRLRMGALLTGCLGRPSGLASHHARSLDVSEWMRNGDYTPSRIDAQYDASTMLCGVKIESNPESTVGILTAGGKGCVLRAHSHRHGHRKRVR